jgi:chromatin modification-related protein YNG2
LNNHPHLSQGRRLNATNSIKITPAVTPTKHRSASPATVTLTTTHATQQKSRLSRQIRPPAEDLDMDADGDDDAEEEVEDETLYCFCQKQSYGDVSICYRRSVIFLSNCFSFQMIACDNEDGCPYEWVRINCLGRRMSQLISLFPSCSSILLVLVLKILLPRNGTVPPA